MSWWEHVWFHLLYFLDLYQFFLWLFNFLIRWINISLGFSLKSIFIILMFIGYIKHFIFSVVWWEHVWLHFFLFLKYINSSSFFSKPWLDGEILALEFSLSVIFRRRRFIGDCKHFIYNVFLWEHIWFNFLCSFEIYQLFLWLFKLWLDGERLAWSFVSKLCSDYGWSEVIVSTSFLMCYDENLFGYMWFFPLNSSN